MSDSPYKAVVVGASAGALSALSELLPPLPRDYPLPIIVVVHVPPDKNSTLPELLRHKCQLDVREAEDKEPLVAGRIYVAPSNYHLQVEPGHYLSLSNEEEVLFSRPSIDILFETAADAYGAGVIGIILTGANNDGARGMRKICDAGGLALVQRPDTAPSRMMPESALVACPKAQSLKIEQIVALLREVVA